MSHTTETIICPNCNTEAHGNYCYQCGQPTHLHKETFWGLIGHSAAHYFHYDSKFWQTMKALWFAPGALTIAYWNRQRMRYLPPISLYIFISAVYFLVGFTADSKEKAKEKKEEDRIFHIVNKSGTDDSTVAAMKIDSVMGDVLGDSLAELAKLHTAGKKQRKHRDTADVFEDAPEWIKGMRDRSKKISKEHGDWWEYIGEKFDHMLPKIFFFMIPLMALLLKLRFFRRKDVYFVDHAIFAIHYHSLWFSVMALRFIPIGGIFHVLLSVALIVAVTLYMIKALQRVYKINSSKALVSTFAIGFSYAFLLSIVTLVSLYIIFMTA